ncbi:Crp/Fnr family transcriptional regulator [Bradyrhizobium sp. 157]|uniref:Crp/Fnr family transcriptional regulator n=1 Tax=Bradyrhizobium sp. 157 TaxID=2782631 RepID=UPI001FFA566B|nr:Crp/Fnr family transcriptional regulator [Bradyrhizobium sp. 157]
MHIKQRKAQIVLPFDSKAKLVALTLQARVGTCARRLGQSESVKRGARKRDLSAETRLIASIKIETSLQSVIHISRQSAGSTRKRIRMPGDGSDHDRPSARLIALETQLSNGCPAHTKCFDRPGAVRPNTWSFVKNVILTSISRQDLAAIGEFLEPIVLKERMVLQQPKRHPGHVYFIESGLVSLRIVAAGSILETAVIGHRGAVGASLFVGEHLSTHQSVVLFPGNAHRIRVEDLCRVMTERPEIRKQLFQYLQALALHCAQTGLCGVRHDREKRLASWLCLASDALGAHVLPVTHDYLSSVLGLRRAGVTETLTQFEKQGLVRKMRGVLQIDGRKGLEQTACGCYKLISDAYV